MNIDIHVPQPVRLVGSLLICSFNTPNLTVTSLYLFIIISLPYTQHGTATSAINIYINTTSDKHYLLFACLAQVPPSVLLSLFFSIIAFSTTIIT